MKNVKKLKARNIQQYHTPNPMYLLILFIKVELNRKLNLFDFNISSNISSSHFITFRNVFVSISIDGCKIRAGFDQLCT